MKTQYIIFFLLLLSSSSFCQSSADEIVKSELAFSDLCSKEGLYTSFSTYLLPDAIVFRPGIKKAKDVYTPDKSTKALTWKPVFVDVSSSGDFGYDTGPWKFERDSIAAYGHFISIWEKQPDNKWRLVFDGGISHPDIKYDEWKIPITKEITGKKTNYTSLKKEEDEIKKIDEVIGKSSAEGLSKSLLVHFANEVRTYREGNLPAIGLDESKKLILNDETKTESKVEYCKVSSAGDLGYTVGSGKIISGDENNNMFAYMRVWKKINNEWKIILDLFSPYKE